MQHFTEEITTLIALCLIVNHAQTMGYMQCIGDYNHPDTQSNAVLL